jgi:ribose transport system ATP-binding protein
MGAIKLQTVDLRKVYPGTVALDDVSMTFEAGSVNALLGKNGAGKSTLVKILSGATEPTSGHVLLDGRETRFPSPRDAFERGMATVYQELSLIPELTVGENILLGRLPKRKGLAGVAIDWRAVFDRADAVMQSLKVKLDVTRTVGRLPVAQQQVVEIAKAMSYDPSVLMLDEPTSALAHHEVAALFDLVRKLTARGVAVIYITHRLQELRDIADTVSVLRDGKFVGRVPVEQATPKLIVEMMFGETVQKARPAGLEVRREPVLEVRHLTMKGKLTDVGLTLYKGEVLGIAGMLGSGRTEVLMSLFGAMAFDEGEIFVEGRPIRSPTPAQMKRAGMGLTPENRKEQGIVLLLSTLDNACLAALDRISRHGVIWRSLQHKVVDRNIRDLQITVADAEQPISSLSGGNQQKVVVSNWLNTKPRIMLFDEPTRGIDVQAKQQMFQIIWELSRQGIGSIFVSSELEELLEVCHRIVVMRKGRVVGEVDTSGLQLESLFAMCMED